MPDDDLQTLQALLPVYLDALGLQEWRVRLRVVSINDMAGDPRTADLGCVMEQRVATIRIVRAAEQRPLMDGTPPDLEQDPAHELVHLRMASCAEYHDEWGVEAMARALVKFRRGADVPR